MSEDLESMQMQVKKLNLIISGYEKTLKLNEQEMENLDEIIKMYENITEAFRGELIDAKKTVEAISNNSKLSEAELKYAFGKIRELEEANRKLKMEKENVSK